MLPVGFWLPILPSLLLLLVVVGLMWQGVSTIMTATVVAVGVKASKALAQPRYQGL